MLREKTYSRSGCSVIVFSYFPYYFTNIFAKPAKMSWGTLNGILKEHQKERLRNAFFLAFPVRLLLSGTVSMHAIKVSCRAPLGHVSSCQEEISGTSSEVRKSSPQISR